jgi:outer membrane protein OmpA-like peptidoglycan-associated protein
MMTFAAARRAVAPVLVSLLLAACGAGPEKVGLLKELDTLRSREYTQVIRADAAQESDPNIQKLRQSANTLIKNSDTYYEQAMEAWDSGDQQTTDIFAEIGLIYYRAAENYARSADARVRLNEANQRYQEQLSRKNDYQRRLQAEQELVTLLETIQTLFERNEELRRSLATIEEQARAESRAIYALQEARIKQTEAEGLKAPDFARAQFAEAQNLLAQAQTFYNDEKFEETYQTALQAQQAFKTAADAARPRFSEEQDRLLRDTESQSIYERGQREFGAASAFVDARGIVIVVSGIFDGRTAGLSDAGRQQVDKVVALAREFRNHAIVIEGHTDDRGSDQSNQALSQTRANSVQDYFLQRSVASSRVSVQAFGESKPRFDNQQPAEREKNNRVEIIFRGR